MDLWGGFLESIHYGRERSLSPKGYRDVPLKGWNGEKRRKPLNTTKTKKGKQYPNVIILQTKMSKRIHGHLVNNKGLPCPFKSIICQESRCQDCQIFHEQRSKHVPNSR